MTDNNNLLRAVVRRCSTKLSVVVFFSLFINLLMFVAPIHMLQIYDRVLISRSEITLVVLTGLAVGLLMIYGLLEGVRSRLLVRVGLQFDELMSDKVFNMVFDTALKDPNIGSEQALRDVDVIRNFISGGAIIALCDAPWVPIFIAACFFLHPILGVVALCGAILIFTLGVLNEFMTKSKLSDATRLSIESGNYAFTSLRNAEIVKALGMVGGIRNKWGQIRDSMLAKQAMASDRAGGIVAASRFIRMGLQVVILATGGYLAVQDLITPGTMIAASIIMGRALAPVEMAVSQWSNFLGARNAYQRMSKLIEIQPVDQEKMDLPEPTGKVSLEGVYVKAPNSDTAILNNVSMEFKPGTITAIVGPSGSGKSSLVRALVGVWPAFVGAVRYDGASVNNWSSDKLGSHIGYMPQDVELFTGTVAQNISRFQDVDSDEVVLAATRAGVHDLILKLPDGYDTNIGAGGQALSGGQRQRLALARAVYKNPKIIVLDEPNSNLDAEGEKALSDAILAARDTGSMVIVISHRPSLLSSTDKIAVLNKGSLVKFGNRDEVLQELGGLRGSGPSSPKPANT
jgi:ATP-binding cassette subfamily C protein/ATP-binding cassette subfamily C protein EexD